MSTMIGNRKKPARGYGYANSLQALRIHVNQAAAIDPAEMKGTSQQTVLQANKAFHIGTIPAGSFILPPTAKVITALAGGGTVDVGVVGTVAGILPSAGLAPASTGMKVSVATGTLLGYTASDLQVQIVLSAAAATGEFDIVIPFYTQAD